MQARGDVINAGNFLTNLFMAYLVVDDQVFRKYITQQQDDCNNNGKDFDVPNLMEVALNKFKCLVEAIHWQTATKVDARIIALISEVNAWKSQKPLSAKSLKSMKNK